MPRKRLLAACCALALAACDDSTSNSPDSGKIDTLSIDLSTQTDGTSVDQGAGGDAAACDAATLAAEAMSSGTKVLGGVTLATSTPIAVILGDMAKYEGQTLRIDGWINEICQDAGCYIQLQDKQGNALVLKVDDGAVNFQNLAMQWQYAVGEGVFNATGSHGAQVHIMQGGAMLGSTICPI